MSLIGQLLKSVIAGGGWTAGKAGAEVLVDRVKTKMSENQKAKASEKSEEEVLDEIELAPDKDDEEEDKQ